MGGLNKGQTENCEESETRQIKSRPRYPFVLSRIQCQDVG